MNYRCVEMITPKFQLNEKDVVFNNMTRAHKNENALRYNQVVFHNTNSTSTFHKKNMQEKFGKRSKIKLFVDIDLF